MRKVLLRGRVVLALFCVVLGVVGCHSIRRPDERVSLCPGGSGSSDKGHPLICVDENDLSNPHPSTITVWDREQQPNGDPSEHPVTIIWATKSGRGNLGVEFRQKGCLEPNSLHCNGHGKCIARTTLLRKGDAPVSCEYDLNLNGRKVDPVVIVQPCCM
jgi:hypothetical protein